MDYSPRRDDTGEPRKKRAKYTSVACNECKRRKLKCSGGEVCVRCARDEFNCVYAAGSHGSGPQTARESRDDGLSDRFRGVDSRIESLQREMRSMAARIRYMETSASPATAAGSASVSSPSGHQRIMNRPQSPTYVGPTSAEFGLDRQRSVESEGDEASADSPVLDVQGMAGDPLGCLGEVEALRLVGVYEDTVGVMYPCVDLDSVRMYVAEYFRPGRGPTTPAAADRDWFFARDVEVLKIILATALVAESHGRSERAALLADSVEDRFAGRVKIAEVDMKELLILTLLSIFHSYRDDEVISWRLIGMAVRGSMQLGLHCQETWHKTGGVFPGELQCTWASRLFWCIYVLDRKWSFGSGLPFAIQDSDMDTNLPEPGAATPYLTCLITYARLSTKIWGLVVGWRSRPRAATSDYCSYLDFQVQQWIQSIPRELRFDPSRRPSDHQGDNMMMLQALLALQANQLRILVYRQNLLSSESIEANESGALTAVETAKSTIHMLDFFSRVSEVYFQRPEPFNYFLISALAALFLAVLHAPARFSTVCRPEFYAAVDMVRRSSTRARTSRRLQKIIRSLKLIRLNMRAPKSTGQADEVQRDVPPENQVSGIPTPQPTSLWSFSPPAADVGPNDCEDLSSFFELAGGFYFDPRTGAEVPEPGDVDAFHAEDEALTKVMAGLL